jgi:hypothetical protein
MKFKAKNGIRIDVSFSYTNVTKKYLWFTSKKKAGNTYLYEYEMVTYWKDKTCKYIAGNMATTKALNGMVADKNQTVVQIDEGEWLAQKALIVLGALK